MINKISGILIYKYIFRDNFRGSNLHFLYRHVIKADLFALFYFWLRDKYESGTNTEIFLSYYEKLVSQ